MFHLNVGDDNDNV